MLLKVCWILLGGILIVYGDDPIVSITETDPPKNMVYNQVIVEKDQPAQLTCNVQNKPETSDVQWAALLSNNTLAISTATAVTTDSFKYSIDQPSPTSWRLRIKNAQVTDEGKYICKVQVIHQNYEKSYEYLRVVEQPKIADLQTSSDTLATNGETVNLRCNATGRPFPVVRWKRLAGELLPSGGQELRKFHLEIYQVKPQDAGVYFCTADNEAGHDERKITLTVKHSPIVQAESERLRQKIGYKKSLVCNVQAYPEASVSWSRDLNEMTSSGNIEIRTFQGALNKATSILTIFSVTENDFGRYTCVALNTDGQGSDTITFVESDTPTPDRSGDIFSGASSLAISFMTLIMLLTTCLLQK